MLNQVGNSADYVVNLVATDAPASWGTALEVGGNTIANGATITVGEDATMQMHVDITPDATPGVGITCYPSPQLTFPKQH